MARPRVTTPPRALPLVGIGLLAIVAAAQLVDVAAALVFLASVALRGEKSLQDVDVTLGYVLARLGLSVALLVITTALRLLVRRWVLRQPPDVPAP